MTLSKHRKNAFHTPSKARLVRPTSTVSPTSHSSLKKRPPTSRSLWHTPVTQCQTLEGDRFIPSRRRVNPDHCRRSLFRDSDAGSPSRSHYQQRFEMDVARATSVPNPSDMLMLGNNKSKRSFKTTRSGIQRTHSNPNWKSAANDDGRSRRIRWSKHNLIAVAYGKRIDIIEWKAPSSAQTSPAHLDTIDVEEMVVDLSWCPHRGSEHILALIRASGWVDMYDFNRRSWIGEPKRKSGKTPLCLGWNPGVDKMLTVGFSDGMCIDVNVQTNQIISQYKVYQDRMKEREVTSIKWNENGYQVLFTVGKTQSSVMFGDARLGESGFLHCKLPVDGVEWCPVHENTAVMLVSSSLSLYDFGAMEEIQDIAIKTNEKQFLCCSSDQSRLYCATADSLQVWEYSIMGKLELSRQFDQRHDAIVGMAADPNQVSSNLISLSVDGNLTLWDALGGRKNEKSIIKSIPKYMNPSGMWQMGLPGLESSNSLIR